MRVVGLARAVADPQHMARKAVHAAVQAILAGQGLLVLQQQRLVAGVEVDLLELVKAAWVNADGFHEADRLLNLLSQAAVLLFLVAVGEL